MTDTLRLPLRFACLALSSLALAACASGVPAARVDAGAFGDAAVDAAEDAAADVDAGDDRDAGPTCAMDSECDDANACNGVETCVAGVCLPGAPVVCDDAVGCTTDTCDPGTGACSAAADDARCPVGLMCDRIDGCIAPRPCESDAGCDDGVFCNGAERCDPSFGCRRGDVPNCDDGFACTVDVCDATSDACVSTAADSACDDGLICNGAELCAPGGAGADGEGCVAGTPFVCDDGVACTRDVCDEMVGGCVWQPDATSCDDGVFCNGAEVCSPSSGCAPGVAPECRDSIGCTVGRCDVTLDACVQEPDNAACADGLACNGDERCDVTGTTLGTGCVAGARIDCSDGLACTTDSCVEPGMCVAGGSDADGDGYTALGCATGDDCDDLNRAIRPGAAELCDGIDNDCSGGGAAFPAGVDDGPGMQCALGSGVRTCTTTCGTAGSQNCNGACRLGACLATTETCNGCDDNGDGRIDEPGPGSTVECRAGETRPCVVPGCGTLGSQTCGEACGWGRCVATEFCNSCDDDGDGSVDNGFSLGGACSVGVGACARTGSVVCRSDGSGTTCSVSAAVPGTELCNAIDDDCDGVTDEPFTELGRPCSVGVGACARTGAFVCRTDGAGTTCSATAGLPGVEACNGLDDDCDGTVDDGADGGACDGADADSCQEGVNRCMAGMLVCDDATGSNTESCNGVDDNCNGATDEGCDCSLGATRSCYGGPAGSGGVGACVTGMQTCVAGSGGIGSTWGTCAGWVGPAAETCNGSDDDCDGIVDDGNPGGGASCDGSDADLCNEGLTTCTAGVLACSDTTSSTLELCNGADDDCNGLIDDGNPGGGTPCDGADGDFCNEGTRSCAGGVFVCSDATGTSVEMCNGVDDDCNGITDDGNPGGGAACDGADTDLCIEGTRVCSGGALLCNDATSSTSEACGNGLDDNCNGSVDEGCSVTTPGAYAIPFAPVATTGTSVLSLTDDGTTGAIPIGFNFRFFNNTYSQVSISSNGFISFDTTVGSGCCSGSIIPSFDFTDNVIAAAWTDLSLTSSGTIRYQTRGTAPNRTFVVSYISVPYYATSTPVTTQIILFETTDRIQIHTTSLPTSARTITQGVEDAAGSAAYFRPGRNATNFTLANDGVEFVTY
jgi:hypothetical protein